ncbi:MAG: hypothetical protein K2N96_02230, partial [Muribaculaceae bacterium]|nr:hypothetical protein [Muribaculaceae bacterium]
MARKVEQNKITKDDSGVSLEHHAAYDDNLLPSAEELSKLKSIEPDIIPWIMERTEKEQDARIEFNHRRMNLAHKEVNCSALLTFFGMLLAAVVIIGVFYFSYQLISNGYQVAGTVFGSID